jgi:hypothetical protein
MNSCALGAVSAEWYQRNHAKESDCLDGCNDSSVGAPACVAGLCVSYDDRGGLVLNCTTKSMRKTKTHCDVLSRLFGGLLSTRTKACQADKDCGTYPAGIVADCGGVTLESIAIQLRRIGQAFSSSHCDFRLECKPMSIRRAFCRQGRCMAAAR